MTNDVLLSALEMSDDAEAALWTVGWIVVFVPLVYGIYRFAKWRAERETKNSPADTFDVLGSIFGFIASFGYQDRRLRRMRELDVPAKGSDDKWR